MADITYKIEKQIGVIGTSGVWETQVNLISWNHAPAKFDIRKWNTETGKMSKGVSLNEEEFHGLAAVIMNYFDGED